MGKTLIPFPLPIQSIAAKTNAANKNKLASNRKTSLN
jgi:hypothetical protein